MTHSIISLGKGFTLDPCKELVSPVGSVGASKGRWPFEVAAGDPHPSALLLRANCQPDTFPIPLIRENLGVLLRTCVRSRWLSLYAHTQRKTGNAPYVSQTRTFENTSLSAWCKKKRWKLWRKERGPDGAGPLDRSRYADFYFMPAHPPGVKAAMPEGTSSPARRCS